MELDVVQCRSCHSFVQQHDCEASNHSKAWLLMQTLGFCYVCSGPVAGIISPGDLIYAREFGRESSTD